MNNPNEDTFDLACTVAEVGPARKTEKGYRFRELVVTTGNPRYPQTIPVSLTGARVDVAGALKPGEPIVLTFSLRGREYNGRRYVSVDGWKIQRYDAAGCLYTAVPPDVASQPTLFPAPVAPSVPQEPAPYDATHRYRPGDRAIIEGKVWIYQERPGAAPWTLAPDEPANSTPSGSLDELPF